MRTKIFIVFIVSLIIFGYFISKNKSYGVEQYEKISTLRNFLYKRHSPLYKYSDKIVYWSEKNGLDYKIYVAISGCESSFGKNSRNYNYTGIDNGRRKFKNIGENIRFTIELISKSRRYTKFRKTNKIEDLVYIYKGVPPYNNYIRTMKWIMEKLTIQNMKVN